MSRTDDILIVGGGVIGLTTAYFLTQRNTSVTVLDRGDFGQESSWAGAGMISPGNPRRAKSPMGRLRAHSSTVFPELSAQLRDETGIDNGYLRTGGLELRRSGDELERQRIDQLLREERGEGTNCEVVGPEALQKLEPLLCEELPGAVLFPEMAQVRNPWHVKALVAALRRRRARLLPHHEVVGYEVRNARILAVKTPQDLYPADRFLLAGGAWSDPLLASLGISLGIVPVRGQIALLNLPSPQLKHILMLGHEYLVPRGDGHVLVGSTEEHVGFEKRNTAGAIAHLIDLALTYVPSLAQATLERCWSGLRPGTKDGRPFLGLVPGYENLFLAAGHYRSGLQLSPTTGLVMSEMLLGHPPTIPLEAFRVDRP